MWALSLYWLLNNETSTLANHFAQSLLCFCPVTGRQRAPSCVVIVSLLLSGQPRTLQDLCRIKIRHCIGLQSLKFLEDLPLAKVMKDYLKHKFDSVWSNNTRIGEMTNLLRDYAIILIWKERYRNQLWTCSQGIFFT